jgi:hypothetical protein
MNTDTLKEQKETSATPNDFEQARALLLSFFVEDGDDSRLPEALMAVRETCSLDAFHRVLILADAVGDPRFGEFGAANALAILRRLEITDDLNADVDTLLEAMREEDAAAYKKVQQEAAEITDPYRQAAIRLMTKFRQPNVEQVERELQRL